MKELTQYGVQNVTGGVIPVAVSALWTAAGGAGLAAGTSVGLNYVNRNSK